MIPILWRYAMAAYLKIFFLSVGTFISVLLVSRFKDIARFAALSSNWAKTGFFAIYQIPVILPMAIPLSALIASLLLFQRMSRTHELTAFRSLGFSFKNLLTPVLFLSMLFSLINFSICTELSPYCRRESNTLLYRETSVNPLLLMQRQNLIRLRDVYMRLKVRDDGHRARNFIFIAYNESNERLCLMSAKKLKIEKEELIGQDVAIISHVHSNNLQFDPLIIENQATLSTAAPVLSDALKKNRPRIDNPSLSLRMLLHRLNEKEKFARPALVEIFRRCSLSIAVFSFTLLGCAFGIEQGRQAKKWPLLYALLLALAILVSYFLGKSFRRTPVLSPLIYILPHLASWFFSVSRLFRLSRGAAL